MYEGHSLVIVVGIHIYFFIFFFWKVRWFYSLCRRDFMVFHAMSNVWHMIDSCRGKPWLYLPQPDSQFILYRYDLPPPQHLALLLKWVNWLPSHTFKDCCVCTLKLTGKTERVVFPFPNLNFWNRLHSSNIYWLMQGSWIAAFSLKQLWIYSNFFPSFPHNSQEWASPTSFL